jgi:flagellum-specific ATP synthase
MARLHAALGATAAAEHFASEGKDVLLMMDSVTRLAMAGRELGLALGEPPTTKGYTPSVFAFSAPACWNGRVCLKPEASPGFTRCWWKPTIWTNPWPTRFGPCWMGTWSLSRKLAGQGHYPAVDVLESLSRLMPDVTSDTHQKAAGRLREVLATYREAEDLIRVGAYVRGTDAKIDYAVDHLDRVNGFLRQEVAAGSSFTDTQKQLMGLFMDGAKK